VEVVELLLQEIQEVLMLLIEEEMVEKVHQIVF